MIIFVISQDNDFKVLFLSFIRNRAHSCSKLQDLPCPSLCPSANSVCILPDNLKVFVCIVCTWRYMRTLQKLIENILEGIFILVPKKVTNHVLRECSKSLPNMCIMKKNMRGFQAKNPSISSMSMNFLKYCCTLTFICSCV